MQETNMKTKNVTVILVNVIWIWTFLLISCGDESDNTPLGAISVYDCEIRNCL